MKADTDDGVPIRNRTRNQLNPLVVPLAIGAAVVFAVTAIGGLILLNSGGSPTVALGGPPDQQADGEKWSLTQFCEYLKSKGVIESFESKGQESSGAYGTVGSCKQALVKFKSGKIDTVIEYPGVLSARKDTDHYPVGGPSGFVRWGKFVVVTNYLDDGSPELAMASCLPSGEYYGTNLRETPVRLDQFQKRKKH